MGRGKAAETSDLWVYREHIGIFKGGIKGFF